MTEPFQRIATDLDFDREGRQVSCLRIVQPMNDSAWHTIEIPAAVISNGGGPSILLVGGVHGDEFEGPIALAKLIRNLNPGDVRGRLIVIPSLNRPAVDAGQRLSPFDGRDLNRSFPGDPGGSATSAIASFVETALLPRVDAVLDLHSGGRSMSFLQCIWMNFVADADLMARSVAAAAAFDAPVTLITAPMSCGALSDSAERRGKIYLSTEVAGGAAVSPAALGIVERGIGNVLRHFGALASAAGTPPARSNAATRFMQIPDAAHYVSAPAAGLFEPLFEIGDVVEAGKPLGYIHAIGRPDDPPCEVACERSGTLIGRRALAHVRQGDGLAAIARDYEMPRGLLP